MVVFKIALKYYLIKFLSKVGKEAYILSLTRDMCKKHSDAALNSQNGRERTGRTALSPPWNVRRNLATQCSRRGKQHMDQKVRGNYGTLQDPTGPYRTLQDPTGPYGTLQDPTGPYRTLNRTGNQCDHKINI